MTDNFDEAKQLKNDAKTNIAVAKKQNSDILFEDALEELDEAISLLVKECSLSENLVVNEVSNSYIQKVAAEIADCYGMSGGVYRRLHKIPEALDMYDKGYAYEADPKYEIQSSYNLVNRIVLRILDNSDSYIEMETAITEAIAIVRRQIDATRSEDWWAWADLGLLYLLNKQVDLANEAYKRIKQLGARRSDMESMGNVLPDLYKQIVKVNTDIATSLQNAGVLLESLMSQ